MIAALILQLSIKLVVEVFDSGFRWRLDGHWLVELGWVAETILAQVVLHGAIVYD